MTTKYLEFDSTYRNRSTWPLPGHFQVLLSASFSSTAATAHDPISFATPIISWQSNRFIESTFGSNFISGTVIYSVYNDPFTIVFSSLPASLNRKLNYYKNSTITSVVGLSSRILSYEYLNNDKALIKLKNPINATIGSTVTITDGTDLIALKIFVPSSPNIENYYAKMLLYDETTNTSTKITLYDSDTGLISLDSAITGWMITDSFSIRKTIPSLVGIVGPSSNISSINLGFNNETNLIGSFIRIVPTYPAINFSNNEIKRIVSYDKTNFIANVYPPFSANPVGLTYEILPYSIDNYNPFTFIGTSQNEFNTCFVKLVSLTLPSTVLAIGLGGIISDYPYVYVQLTPLNTSNLNITSSNNPNANITLFKATKRSNDGNFIKFTGDDVVQIVKFKIENDFMFKITIPSGETLETIAKDFYSPNAPNPLVQISALFEIKRKM